MSDKEKTIVLSDEDIVHIEHVHNLISNLSVVASTMGEQDITKLVEGMSPEVLTLKSIIDKFKDRNETLVEHTRRNALMALFIDVYDLSHTRSSLLYDDVNSIFKLYS